MEDEVFVVPAIVSKSNETIKEELLEEIDLTPSQETKNLIDEIISNASKSYQNNLCTVPLTDEQGNILDVRCVNINNEEVRIYVHPNYTEPYSRIFLDNRISNIDNSSYMASVIVGPVFG